MKYGWQIFVRQHLTVSGVMYKEHSGFHGLSLGQPRVPGSKIMV